MLDGHTVLLTGASGTLGRSLLKNFVSRNCRVVCLTRNSEEFMSLVMRDSCHNDLVHVIEADFTEDDWSSDVKSKLLSQSLVPSILINNAAINTPFGTSKDIPIKEWRDNFEINFFSAILLTQIFLELRNPETQSWIFNVSGGGVTHKPMPYFSPYACSKSALIRFTECLAIELQNQDVSVNAITPGFLASNIHQPSISDTTKLPKEIREKIVRDFNAGGQDPNKTFSLIQRIVEIGSMEFSGNLLSPIWDTIDDIQLSQETINRDIYKLRRINSDE